MVKEVNLYSDQEEFVDKIRNISNDYSLKNGRKPRYFSLAFGCQQNESDTEKINGMLDDMGYEKTDSREYADLIIYNTCAVREHAEQRVIGTIGSLVSFKRDNPDVIICFCGCMMQRKEVSDEIKRKYRHVDLVFGPHAIGRFPENLYNTIVGKERLFDISYRKDSIVEGIPIKRDNRYKAWVSIMYGCNNYCSYCIVPYLRGREISRQPEAIIDEVSSLVANGYKDITLLGQNVNSYCNDSNNDWSFAKLLRHINCIDGDFRLRFMTSHPKDATKELIDTMADCNKICKHLHLPFQSGSNRILKLMNRRYTREDYIDLIKYAKKQMPDIVLTSDVIVGFPTESEDDFLQTMSLVDEVCFQGLYTFIYSVRKGTPAAEMEQVEETIKHERFDRLCELQIKKGTEYNSKYIGKTVKILVEGYSGSNNSIQTGRTDGNIIVNFPSCNAKAGEYRDIKIDKALNWALFGKSVN